MTQRQGLENYIALLCQVHEAALQENARLRARQPLDEPFLDRKRLLSYELDIALQSLHDCTPAPPEEREIARALQSQLQDRMLQTIMLDRENETLLLKSSLQLPSAQPSTSAAVRRAYGAGSR